MKDLCCKQLKPCKLFFSMVFVFLLSCESFNPDPNTPSKNLRYEEAVEVATQNISAGGGTVVVNAPGSEIDGMEIVVPPGSYASSRSFKISTAEITSNKLGAYFKPLTPLIQIDNGDGYSEKVMEITIPINLPEGHIPTAFYYDIMSGRLKGVPFKDYTSTSITLLTRHFMSETELYSGVEEETKKSASIEDKSKAHLVICHIDEEEIKNKSVVTSGFKPGVDDWEFPNWSSYISPTGHCYGMTITAIWYYHKRFYRGGDPLYHRFDTYNKPSGPKEMWQDNPLGYRFASVIQEMSNFDDYVEKMEEQFKNPNKVFYNYIYLLLVTNEPQVVVVRNKASGVAHGMIVYKANMREGKLYLADPNFPNNREPHYGVSVERVIEYTNGTFKPYDSAPWAGATSFPMEQIAYFGESDNIDWKKIGAEYSKFTNQSVGNDKFPSYSILSYENEKYKTVEDGFSTEKDTLRIVVECPDAEIYEEYGGMRFIGYAVFREDKEIFRSGDGILPDASSPTYLVLKPGVNKLGFYIFAKKKVMDDNKEVEKELFIDFKWLTLYQSKLKIDPNPILAEPGKEVGMKALYSEKAPGNATYSWNFGDNTAEKTVANDNAVKHTYQKEGTYQVRVKLYEGKTKLIAEASAVATITGKLGAPEITRISPDSAIGEQQVTIHGNNFGDKQYEGSVSIFYNENTEIISWSNNQIVIKIPLKAKNDIGIRMIRKTPGDTYSVSSNNFSYRIYPDILVTLKRINKIGWVLSGPCINQYGDERTVQVHMAYHEPNKLIKFNGLSFDYTGSDTLDNRPGREIFYRSNIHLTVTGDGQMLSGTIGYTAENRSITSTLYSKQEIQISNMKLDGFSHERVAYSFTESEAKSVIGSFLDDGGHGWDNYVDFKTAHGGVTFYEKTW